MSKYLLWVVPVGVAAGLSLPLVVSVRKAPVVALPPPAAPRVSVEYLELRSPVRKSDAAVSVTAEQASDLGSLASNYQTEPPKRRKTYRSVRRSLRKLDSRSMSRLQFEDMRAWHAANRMLADERRGT